MLAVLCKRSLTKRARICTPAISLTRCVHGKYCHQPLRLAGRNVRRSLSSTTKDQPSLSALRIAQDEAEDITKLDELLNIVRSRSNPEYRSIVLLRTPRLWSEYLLTGDHDKSNEAQTPPKPPEQPMQTRHMHDSYSQLVLPFLSAPQLLEQYVNAWGGLRLGKLLEHLDSLAGSIAYKHLLGPSVQTLGKIKERGFYVVTAAVDRLDVLSSLAPVCDVRLSGHVIYTGRSSMEIIVRMEALEQDGSERTAMIGRFSMVCRDAETHKARPVNPLAASSPEEEDLLRIGQSLKHRRQAQSQYSLTRVPPTSEEAVTLHDVYLKDLKQTQESATGEHYERVWMEDTRMEKTMLMFPQERNVHQKVFGGYLMRLAYELSFSNATIFTHRQHLRFLSLDGICFTRPVPIGSILRLTSHVTYSSTSEFAALMHVFVNANVIDVESGAELSTNDFRFTWCDMDGEPLQRMVVPRTYADAMSWIEGKRAVEMGAKIRGLRLHSIR